jgi:hypothetical protein
MESPPPELVSEKLSLSAMSEQDDAAPQCVPPPPAAGDRFTRSPPSALPPTCLVHRRMPWVGSLLTIRRSLSPPAPPTHRRANVEGGRSASPPRGGGGDGEPAREREREPSPEVDDSVPDKAAAPAVPDKTDEEETKEKAPEAAVADGAASALAPPPAEEAKKSTIASKFSMEAGNITGAPDLGATPGWTSAPPPKATEAAPAAVAAETQPPLTDEEIAELLQNRDNVCVCASRESILHPVIVAAAG